MAEIGQVIIFLFKIPNFVGYKYNNLSWLEQNYGVKVNVTYQFICATTHIWIYFDFIMASKVLNK